MTIVVLGGGINTKGQIPEQSKKRLDRAIEVFKKQKQANILLCGKHSFLYPKDKIPPKTEAEAMSDYLLSRGIKKSVIFLEKKSKDSIGNAYYAKKLYFIPKKESQAIIITSEFHMERSKFIFQKIFGKKYHLKFTSAPSPLKGRKREQFVKRQKDLLKKTKTMLANMELGDHNFLKGKLYKLKYYKTKRPAWVIRFTTQGK